MIDWNFERRTKIEIVKRREIDWKSAFSFQGRLELIVVYQQVVKADNVVNEKPF